MKLHGLLSAGIIILLLVSGCQQHTHAESTASDALLKADQALSAASAKDGIARAFPRYALVDALLLPQGGVALKGRPQIAKSLANIPSGTRISWTPQSAEASGKLGYSWGIYTTSGVTAGGQSTVTYGKYLSVWKYRDDKWKLAIMMINQSPGPTG